MAVFCIVKCVMALYTMVFVYHYTLLENKAGNPMESDASALVRFVCYARGPTASTARCSATGRSLDTSGCCHQEGMTFRV